ncbi:Ubl-specific protease [Fusarium beomiforme]|uniref:Ubl-specific protease n=1 Tax=Fusarium beomiforme TaxID=44412 RepID=A0A9P5ARB1_9HYPO|nr:Ubl-specific protease [Fusarium beomiforme]
MSFSFESRISMHQSANQNGRPVPPQLAKAAHVRRQLRIASKAKPTTQVQASSQLPKAELVTPPRQISRPYSRLMIDSPFPCPDIFKDQALRNRFVDTDSPPPLLFFDKKNPRPNSRAQPVRPNTETTNQTTPKSTSDPDFAVVNGKQTRKRRAQDTEIDLVAADNGVEDTKGRLFTDRKGESSKPGYWPRGPLRPQSYQIAECRSYLSKTQVSNKRVKISTSGSDTTAPNNGAPDQDAGLRWLDQDGLITLIEGYKHFSKSLVKVWECLERGTRQEANKDLSPLSTDIVDDKNRAALYDGLAHDCVEIFTLQLKRVFEYLDKIYEISVIVKIRDNNEFVPPILDYGLSTEFAEHLESIKHFLSGPALPVVCKNILQKYGEKDWNVSQAFLDQVVLDIKAILRNLPAPSYVNSQEYRGKLQAMFPTPPRTDLETRLLLPGSFPDLDELKERIDQTTDEQTEQPTEATASKSTVQAFLHEPVPASSRPDINRPSYFKTDFLRAGLAQESIDRITPEDYRQTFYEESNEHRAIKNQYITDFTPKSPLTSGEAGSLRSILRNRRKHPSKVTPKRLAVLRRPKTVRFIDDTVSPKPRTHLGLDVPKRINYNQQTGQALPPPEEFQEQRPNWARTLLNIPRAPVEEPPNNATSPPSTIAESLRRGRLEQEQEDGLDVDARIRALFALPSVLPSLELQISDDSRAGIERQVEEAAQRAAEEARLAAEAAQREAEEKARIEREERLARSGGLREPRQTFVAPVSSDWHRKAMETLRASGTTALAKSAEGVDLRKHDFAKIVSSTEWLNDEIVNASLLWLDRAINSAAGIKDVKRNTRKIFTPGSFFFKRLQDAGVKNTQRTMRRYGVEKRNFLDIETILLPICEHSHWTLLVIRPTKRTVAHMDSINAGGNRSYINRAMGWIENMLEEKFIKNEWKVILHEAPLQNNGHDCGVHTITNAMCIALGISPIEAYTANDMPTQRIRIACMLLNGGFTGDFDLRVY